MSAGRAALRTALRAPRRHASTWAAARRPPALRISAEVHDALQSNKPVVALESTIISHGLPYPQNLETALAVEAAIIAEGAVPATTALLDGHAHVGLSREQLQRLASPDKSAPAPVKTSRRDMAQVIAMGEGSVGGTTVSGTMVLAEMAGVDIFATGGIGGVHRGGHHSMDVSADLTELSRTPVAVFCSGAKSILDIPRTLEFLETQGVGVAAFAPQATSSQQITTDFPAFYSASSGCTVPLVRSPAHAASIIAASKGSLGLSSGLVFAVPIPAQYEAAGQAIQAAVEQAVRESVEQGIDKRGKEVTPWLLKRVKELSSDSVESNVALVVNNSRVAARTAVELCRLRQEQGLDATKLYASAQPSQDELPAPELVLFGGVVLDVTSRMAPGSTPEMGARTTAAGSVSLTLGGVGRNMAQAAQRVMDQLNERGGKQVQLVAPLAVDSAGHFARSAFESAPHTLRTDGLFAPDDKGASTPTASLVLEQGGDLLEGIIDTSALETAFAPAIIHRSLSPDPKTIAFDSNLSVDAMVEVLSRLEARRDAFVLCEPTSVTKSARVVHALHRAGLLGRRHVLGAVTPNLIELLEMHKAVQQLMGSGDPMPAAEDQVLAHACAVRPEDIAAAAAVARAVGPLYLTLGPRGVIVISAASPASAPVFTHVPVPAEVATGDIVNTTGAGDTFAGALLAVMHIARQRQAQIDSGTLRAALSVAQLAAQATLRSADAVGDVSSLRLSPHCERFIAS